MKMAVGAPNCKGGPVRRPNPLPFVRGTLRRPAESAAAQIRMRPEILLLLLHPTPEIALIPPRV